MSLLTEEQLQAVNAKGETIVSASAGSGKTFVMIERLAKMIASGTEIKKILAVTFTNRAAAQIRERLREALLGCLKEAEGKRRVFLKSQLFALMSADISTIHSFCARIVRSYFYLVGIDPAFRIVAEDSFEGSILYSRALDEVFEKKYAERDEEFHLLLQVYFHKKKDEKLKTVVRMLYREIRKSLDYRDILKNTGAEDLFECICGEISDDLNERIANLQERVAFLSGKFNEKDKIRTILSEQETALGILSGRTNLFSLREAAKCGVSVSRMPPSSKYEGRRKKDYLAIKAVTGRIKEIYEELNGYADFAKEQARYENARAISRALAGLILEFDATLTRMKKENGVLDYNDLESYAYEILQNGDALAAVRARYDDVFVDEYQDVNAAQESILNLVGNGEIFLVGDAKQAIYAFRGSRSEFFLKRKESFGHSLSITENFRSAPAILEAVNKVFSYSMTKKTAGFDYVSEPMRGGSRYGGHDGKVKFYFASSRERSESERGVYSIWDKREAEYDPQAELVADLVLEEVGSEWYDADRQRTESVRFRDIAILLRNNTGAADRVIRSLSRRGVPVESTAKVNICDFWEARLIIDVLSYLDNPEQDIPLAAALLSRIGGMSENELCKIREAFPSASNFRTACREYLRREDTVAMKLRLFFQRTEKLRALAQVKPCAEIANLLLGEGLEAEIFSKKNGALLKARVNRLVGEMQGSVSEFLRRLKAVGYKIDYSETGAEDAVKVMTVHSSKGLEFPVVILADLDKPFHGAERDETLYTEKYSIAPKSFDCERGIVYGNVLRRVSVMQLDREERRGELNLFYVAMTRAKYRLHMIFKDGEQTDPQYARRFSDFVDFDACEEYFTDSDWAEKREVEHHDYIYRPDQTVLEQIKSVYRMKYPFESSVALPIKSSATRIMEEEKQEETFSSKRGGATVEEGLAYHAFLQHVDFSQSAEAELLRMEQENLLRKEQLALLKKQTLQRILSLPSMSAMRGKKVFREQRFLAMLPARDLYSTDCGDEILVQGAIDAMYESERGWMILDYKYSARGEEELKRSYAPQIAIYRKAAARALKIDSSAIGARIINILRGEEIEM